MNLLSNRYYVFKHLPEKKECFSFCNGTGDEDRNVLYIEDGIVRFAHKGVADECNNVSYEQLLTHATYQTTRIYYVHTPYTLSSFLALYREK